MTGFRPVAVTVTERAPSLERAADRCRLSLSLPLPLVADRCRRVLTVPGSVSETESVTVPGSVTVAEGPTWRATNPVILNAAKNLPLKPPVRSRTAGHRLPIGTGDPSPRTAQDDSPEKARDAEAAAKRVPSLKRAADHCRLPLPLLGTPRRRNLTDAIPRPGAWLPPQSAPPDYGARSGRSLASRTHAPERQETVAVTVTVTEAENVIGALP